MQLDINFAMGTFYFTAAAITLWGAILVYRLKKERLKRKK